MWKRQVFITTQKIMVKSIKPFRETNEFRLYEIVWLNQTFSRDKLFV